MATYFQTYTLWCDTNYWWKWFQLENRRLDDTWTEVLTVTPEIKEYVKKVFAGRKR